MWVQLSHKNRTVRNRDQTCSSIKFGVLGENFFPSLCENLRFLQICISETGLRGAIGGTPEARQIVATNVFTGDLDQSHFCRVAGVKPWLERIQKRMRGARGAGVGTESRDIASKGFCCNPEQRNLTMARGDVRSRECPSLCCTVGEIVIALCCERSNIARKTDA